MAEHRLTTPVSEGQVRKIRVGDLIYISGVLYSLRDAGHRRALEYLRSGKPLPVSFSGMAVYHMGPVVRRMGGKWRIISAGPTTSARMEDYVAEFIEGAGVRVMIGKGGMGFRTAEACRRFGALYAVFPGGAGALAAKAIEDVEGVEWLDLGVPEALWVMRVRDFGPLLVAIDSEGNNYYEVVRGQVLKNLKAAYSIVEG